jgi:hypothetical protein
MLEERLVFAGAFITAAATVGSPAAITLAMVLAIRFGNCLIGSSRGKLSLF